VCIRRRVLAQCPRARLFYPRKYPSLAKKPGSLSTPARNTYNHAFHQHAVLYSRLPTLLCSKFNVQSGREEEVDESMFENELITIDEVNVLHEELVRGFG